MRRMTFILQHITVLLIWITVAISIAPSKNIIYSPEGSIGDIVDYITSKGYLPNEKELSRVSKIKSSDNDATYLLSKLSDEELLKLLNEQPQRSEFNLNDIIRIAFGTKKEYKSQLQSPNEPKQSINPNNLVDTSLEKKRFCTVTNNEPLAYYRLNHKPVKPNREQNDANYIALQKLKSLLNVYPQPKSDDITDDKKQIIFDILVAQLKTLCCKESKRPSPYKGQHETLINEILQSMPQQKSNVWNQKTSLFDFNNKYNEFMFLIINDEIKSNGSDELIEVDPESLDSNSSVLLLGPVTSPLTDDQLKLVMSRITNELMKPEYIYLLQQLSNGILSDNNKNLMKDLVFGPNTRRYIKPHRCNHQSKLAKVYGGPKWIVCTGYLNLNKPSLYD